MPLTDRSAIYIALHQDAISHSIKSMMFHRPSLFNSGTKRVNENHNLLCIPIEANPNSDKSLWVARKKPLKLFGKYNLDFCYQLKDVELKFYPDGGLTENQFLLKGTVHVGIGIPENDVLDPLIISDLKYVEPEEEVTIETEKLQCFQLHFEATGYFEISKLPEGKDDKGDENKWVPFLKTKISAIKINEVFPGPLEQTIKTFLYTSLSRVKTATYYNLVEIITLAIKPSTSTPNPLIGDNQLKLYFDTEVSPT
ncbi:hypothetical protein SFC65_19570 [Priestia filamentosa]|uniref:hypothetical protein n=1 Tax=Priestia filamentosa TaxID=1402861 RepID=UPI0039823EEB